MENKERKELNEHAKKIGGKHAKWIGLTGSFTNTGKKAKSEALKKKKGEMTTHGEVERYISKKQKDFQRTGWKDEGLGGRYIPKSLRK